MGSLKKLWGWYSAGNKWVKLKVDSNGKILLSSIQTKARAYLAADQSDIVSGAWTKVLLDTESYDIGSNFDSYKFTAPVTGYYIISAEIVYTSIVANKRYYTAIYKNDALITYNINHSSHAETFSCTLSDIIYLSADDWIELYGLHLAGVNTVDIAKTWTFMAIHLLSV